MKYDEYTILIYREALISLGELIRYGSMSKTIPNNVQAICKDHYRMGRYGEHTPDWFIGKLVKIGFRSSGDHLEYMWCKVLSEGTAILDNEPMFCDYLEWGDTVTFDPVEVLDVHAMPEGATHE